MSLVVALGPHVVRDHIVEALGALEVAEIDRPMVVPPPSHPAPSLRRRHVSSQGMPLSE
jgi:hypothetical protein